MEGIAGAIIPAVIGGLFSLIGVWLKYVLSKEPSTPTTAVAGVASIDQAPAVRSGPPIGQAVIDVGLLFILTAIGGFIVGFASGGADIEQLKGAIAISNIIFVIIGFTIAASRYKTGRWGYLFLVTILFWFASAINIAFGYVNPTQWLASMIILIILMGISGALSYLFRGTK